MDDNNQNTNPSQPDLSAQYDEILEKYSQQLTTATPEPVLPPEPEPIAQISPPLPPVAPEPSPSYEPVLLPPADDYSPPVLPKQSNFFKILFFISLLIFLGVAGIIVYTIFFAPSPRVDLTLDSITPTIAVEPSPSGPVCELNDKRYTVGETFTATDGCNTCTCDENLMISCTEKACPSTTSIEQSPTSKISLKAYSGNGFVFSYPESVKVLGDLKTSTFVLQSGDKIATFHFYKMATGSSLDEVFFKRLSASDPFSVAKYVTVTSEKISDFEFKKYVQDPEYFKQQSGELNHLLTANKTNIIEFQFNESSLDFVKELISTLKVK